MPSKGSLILLTNNDRVIGNQERHLSATVDIELFKHIDGHQKLTIALEGEESYSHAEMDAADFLVWLNEAKEWVENELDRKSPYFIKNQFFFLFLQLSPGTNWAKQR